MVADSSPRTVESPSRLKTQKIKIELETEEDLAKLISNKSEKCTTARKTGITSYTGSNK